MNILVKLASGFMNLFTLGGEQFVSWVTGIIPTVLMLLLLMNAIIALAGDESVNKLARVCTKNPILRYLVLPFVSAFMLGNPMALSNFINQHTMLPLHITVIQTTVFSHILMHLNFLYGLELQMESLL